jgi:hypothetical protein
MFWVMLRIVLKLSQVEAKKVNCCAKKRFWNFIRISVGVNSLSVATCRKCFSIARLEGTRPRKKGHARSEQCTLAVAKWQFSHVHVYKLCSIIDYPNDVNYVPLNR